MKTKPYLYSQPDYLIFRAAIGGILVQRSDSLSFEASEVLVLIYFCILCSTKSYKETSGFLRAEPLSSYFEDRKGYREGKVQPAQLQGEFLSAKSVFPPLNAAPIDDEAKKHNENLPGMGGVFNVVNLHVYHYAGYMQRSFELYNPIKYTEPDGRSGKLTIYSTGNSLMGAGWDFLYTRWYWCYDNIWNMG
ncbi:hypothetical protein [Treponema putidum]|uniref:hypothetical protein n=1 Tax=Treponema putidum TaxID=221027 RepID=UPI002106AA9D|nr:hypothetical protein [Treponema putidum]